MKTLKGRPLEICSGLAGLDWGTVVKYRAMFAGQGYELPPEPERPKHDRPVAACVRTHSTIGTELLAAFEAALGKSIGCGSCKTVLLSFNRADRLDVTDAEDKIYRVSLEIPESICPRGSVAQRAWIRGIVEGVAASTKQIAPHIVGTRIDDRPQVATPDYFAGRCVAVTSFNPNPARWERQLKCAESWIRYGLPVIVVNTQKELDSMHLPTGVTQVPCESLTSDYDRQTQFVSSLIRVGRETELPFMLINSDIEIHGSTQLLDNALLSLDKLTIGIRYNHDASTGIKSATREASGLDVFLMTGDLSGSISDAPFGIGKPAWDYWLPEHFRSAGVKFNWIREPLFFHERHKLGWTRAEWDVGSEYMKQKYGVHLGYGSNEFRRSLEKW